jgi:methylmalonyl-CoA mutase N-terminal domain/subunit
VETLTNEIEKRASEYLAKIDTMGGMLKAIERGYVQQEIQNAAYEFQKSVDSKEQVLVGVNAFQLEHEKPISLLKMDPELERHQVERLRAFRAKRDPAKAAASVRKVDETARAGGNLVPVIVEAVESNSTVGEICDAMRKVFGEYKEVMVI